MYHNQDEEVLGGFCGMPTLGVFTNYQNFDWSNFVFNLVFCATAATIVSGSMAERTKFSSYCIYSAVISAVVYPIEAGWIWNPNGWLANLGFHDFAGSCAIHTVGGITAFIGAIMVGPRIGKYVEDKKTGKKVAKAIPGHSLTLGELGVFILWFGWYGFNGAAAKSGPQLASIFLTTTTTRIPETAPIRQEPRASTTSHPAVTATRPASEALSDIETSGLPFLIQVKIIVTQVAIAGAHVVVKKIEAS